MKKHFVENELNKISKWSETMRSELNKIACEQRDERLRDQFAMAALTGLIASMAGDSVPWLEGHDAASMAYNYADAMMKVRKK